MRKLGKKMIRLELQQKLDRVPHELADFALTLSADGRELIYTYDSQAERPGITRLLEALPPLRIRLKDIDTMQSSLEDIFVDLLRRRQ
jgi:ABC-2 type transport system ATP-binding protein